jgi:hypothetical protein
MGDNITILPDEMGFPPPTDILGGFNFVPQSPIIPPEPPINIGGPTLDITSIPERPYIPPLREQDIGFGPGIRRSEDFFRPEDLMMPPVIPTPPPLIDNLAKTDRDEERQDIRNKILRDEERKGIIDMYKRMPPPPISERIPATGGTGLFGGALTKKDINEAILQIDTPPVINTPDITQGLFNLQTPQVPTGGRFSIDTMTPSLLR